MWNVYIYVWDIVTKCVSIRIYTKKFPQIKIHQFNNPISVKIAKKFD